MRINKLKMLTDDEIRELLEGELKKIQEPVQVVFANQRCIDCGQVQIPSKCFVF